MRTLSIVAAALLTLAAVPAAAAPRLHPVPTPHGPPNIPNTFVCKVPPRYGGGQCTTNPYPHLGAPCACDGPRGLATRPGVVSTR